MKKAIQFGAGNIGRGFIGAVLEQAGYHVVFADVNEQVVARINSDRAYTVQIMDTVCEQMRITDISAMDSRSPELAAQIAGAELVTTAVGLTVLPRIAGAIAAGIAARRDAGVTEPLNVIACENGVRATTQLREAVLKHLDEAQRDWCEQYVGFPDCSVDRIVPPVKSENPIDVVVERFFEWNVERAAFKGAVPEIPGMNPADNLIAYIERKLFTLNTGHAITAYLGRMKGYMTICQSISDEHIHTIVKAAMRESGRGLVALYGFDRDAHFAYIDKIIGRFRNPYLCDDVTRVGREPLRKLSAGDRLVRPILTARRYGIGTPDLLRASAPRCITTTRRTCRAWKCAVWSKRGCQGRPGPHRLPSRHRPAAAARRTGLRRSGTYHRQNPRSTMKRPSPFSCSWPYAAPPCCPRAPRPRYRTPCGSGRSKNCKPISPMTPAVTSSSADTAGA
ncbi:MAG: mannitol-1-phosphate 5-dehydrogenase [Alistipes onderdonkii]